MVLVDYLVVVDLRFGLIGMVLVLLVWWVFVNCGGWFDLL